MPLQKEMIKKIIIKINNIFLNKNKKYREKYTTEDPIANELL